MKIESYEGYQGKSRFLHQYPLKHMVSNENHLANTTEEMCMWTLMHFSKTSQKNP